MFKKNTEHCMNNCNHALAIHGFLHLKQVIIYYSFALDAGVI